MSVIGDVMSIDPSLFGTVILTAEETVLGFDDGIQGPYYASRGTSNADASLMTCFLTMQHHTEFSRKYVTPVGDGVKAVK